MSESELFLLPSLPAQAFAKAMKASKFPWCKVFDLAGEQPFSDSLLDCLFHGLKEYYGSDKQRDEELLKSELELVVEFNNLPILVRAFRVAHCR